MTQSLILGHRGASGHAPENTLASFRMAFALRADGLELDVHQTKDGSLVVCHDAKVDRTTNGHGEIGEMTLAEIKQLDAGIWFGEAFKGERIPTLEEVFAMAPLDALLNIEVKAGSRGLYPLERRLTNAILSSGRTQQVVVSSFETQYLINLYKACPLLRLGLLIKPADSLSFTFDGLLPIPFYSLHPYFAVISKQWVIQAHEKGYRVFAWTANEIKDMEYCMQSGVDGIITNYPERGKLVKRS